MRSFFALMSKIYLGLLLLLIFSQNVEAQVEDVNKNLEKSKNKTETTTLSTTSGETKNNGFWGILFEVVILAIPAAQAATLENKHFYPERVSFNTYFDYGFGFPNNVKNFSSTARVNWGIFGSEFKYASLTDNTGILNTYEWQIGIFRIPIKAFNLEYGLGIIGIPKQSQSYGLNSIGFDFKLRRSRINIQSHYTWTQRTNLSARFKKSFEVITDYEFIETNKFHLGAMFKYSFQRYFDETNFSVVSLGLVMKLY